MTKLKAIGQLIRKFMVGQFGKMTNPDTVTATRSTVLEKHPVNSTRPGKVGAGPTPITKRKDRMKYQHWLRLDREVEYTFPFYVQKIPRPDHIGYRFGKVMGWTPRIRYEIGEDSEPRKLYVIGLNKHRPKEGIDISVNDLVHAPKSAYDRQVRKDNRKRGKCSHESHSSDTAGLEKPRLRTRQTTPFSHLARKLKGQ